MTKYVNNNGVSEMWLNIKNWVTSQLLGYSQTGHTHSASDITSGLSTVATSGSYNDLSNKPTIPTVNNATLTIQKNSSNVATFTANASSNVTANISVPTKVSQLTNDSGFLTAHQSLSNYVDRSSEQAISGNKTFNDRTRFKKGSYIHSFGSGQDVGYIKFATITIDDYYQDCTATLVIMNRSYYKPVYVYIKFNGTDNVDPNINFFATDATNNNANDYYLVKSATSTWDLYVYKTAWNTFCVLDFWQSQNNTAHVTFTWKAEFVSSLPSGNIKATFSAYNYNDLSNKPTIPTVNNATLTIQKNGSNVATFTANASSNVTANITVPTNTNQLTNGAGFITSSGSCNYANSAGSVAWNNVTGKPSFSSNPVQIGYTTQKTGTWTLTGVVPYKPVIFYFSIWNYPGSIALPNNNAAWVVGAKQTSTSSSDYNDATKLWKFISGDHNKSIVKASALIIPLSSTVSISINVSGSNGVNLYAYQ